MRKLFIILIFFPLSATLAQESDTDTVRAVAEPAAAVEPAKEPATDSVTGTAPKKAVRRIRTELGALQVKPTSTFMPSVVNETEKGLYIPNTTGGTPLITELKAYVSRRGVNRASFYFHVYEYDKSTGRPGRELFPGGVKARGFRGGRWDKVDVAHHNIRMPESGIVITFSVPTENFQSFPDSSYDRKAGEYKYFTYPLICAARNVRQSYLWQKSNGSWANQLNNTSLSPALAVTVEEEE